MDSAGSILAYKASCCSSHELHLRNRPSQRFLQHLPVALDMVSLSKDSVALKDWKAFVQLRHNQLGQVWGMPGKLS